MAAWTVVPAVVLVPGWLPSPCQPSVQPPHCLARESAPLPRNDRILFEVLLLGEHALRGFAKRDLRHKLARTSFPLASEADKRPGQVTRLLRRLHAHGLVAKIQHSRRWRASLAGRRTMTTAIKLRDVAYPSLFAPAAGHRAAVGICLARLQRNRVLAFINPALDPATAWQPRQAMNAVGSGRFIGKGFLQGTQIRLRSLPARPATSTML